MVIRPLARDEIDTIWTIDRSEVIHHVYRLRDGVLVLEPAYCDARGWPPGEIERVTPLLHACFDRGGGFYGMFDDRSLIGAAVLDGEFIGPHRDWLVLKFLYVSRDHRGRGVGARLFEHARSMARVRGAKQLYISSSPTQNTVDFYIRRGCEIAPEPDPALLALEPDDIHLLCRIPDSSVERT